MQVARTRTLESIMKSPRAVVAGTTSVLEALRLCETRGTHHLPLFEGSRLIGVVCTCDLEEVPLDAPVSQAVRREPVTLEVTASVADAVQKMSEEVVGSVLVMRSGDLVGIVTREDVTFSSTGEVANFRCEACGALTHLKREDKLGVLCFDCRSRSGPASIDEDEAELGGSG